MSCILRSNVVVAAFLASALLVHSSKAEVLSGAGDPAFLAAVQSWLDDRDADSLPVLSSLAHEGNAAARLLLSRIEITDRASSKYVKGLPRKERLDLFRQKTSKGIFRPSWIMIESESGNPVAAALLDATSLGIIIPAIQRLYEIGEIEATELLVKNVAANGSQVERKELAEFLAPGSEFAPYLRAFIYAREGVTTGQAALQRITGALQGVEAESVELADDPGTRTAMAFVDVGYQAGIQTSDYGQNNNHYGVVAQWVMAAPEAAAVANVCRRVCSVPEIPACANTVFGLIGGYYEVIRFDSPLEAVIPQSRFVTSERATAMVLRRIAFATTEAGEEIFPNRELTGKSKCLINAVVALRARTN